MVYDIMIFGATGYTGQYVVEFLVRNLQKEANKHLTWAVAGRTESKLTMVLKAASEATGQVVTDTPLIICDSSDQDSILGMAKQARLVVNCVGPYRFHGEAVVQACVEAGAHHVDISGEPEYLEKMQMKYHVPAEEKGVYVVGACGFDSVPADLGQVFLAKNMGGDVNEIETYLEVLTIYSKTLSLKCYSHDFSLYKLTPIISPKIRRIYLEN